MTKSKTLAVVATNKQQSALPGVMDSQASQTRLNNAIVGTTAGKTGSQEDQQEDDLQQCGKISDSIKKIKKRTVSQNSEHEAATMSSKAAKARKVQQQAMQDDDQTVI